MQIDLYVMELLASKLCHDLVSPVSAINNGVELIEDIGGSVVAEAMKLIGDSGATASRRLRLYRLAYGRAGSESALGVKDVRQVAEQYLSVGKITLAWPEGVPTAHLADQRGFLKVVLNLMVLAEECLAYGGAITLRDIEGSGCRFEVVGRNAGLSPQLQEALQGSVPVEQLTPRSIQAYLTGRFAEHFSFKLAYDHSIPDRLDMSLTLDSQSQSLSQSPPEPPLEAKAS
jgi:histidine phosphotransferase ChpT